MDKFEIKSDVTKKNKRFKVYARTLEFTIKSIPEETDPSDWVREAIDQAILYATKELQPTDKVGITFCSRQFNRGDGWVRFQDAANINTDDVWDVLTSIFQSNSMGLSTDTFCLGVTSVRMPVGKGRANHYNTFNEECAQRKGIVSIKNMDNLCLPRALVVAIAHTSKDPKYKEVQRDIRKEQTTRTLKLIADAGVIIPDVGCGIEEVQRFQEFLKDYKITVYSYGNKGRDTVFEGPKGPKKLNLLYHKGHYNVITSLTAAFCCVYFCEVCHIPYNHKNKHRCGGTCPACQQSPACEFKLKIKCEDCGRNFRGEGCYQKHKLPRSYDKNFSICATLIQCADCLKTLKTGREHFCGEIFCKLCKKHQPQGHLCYMQPDTKTPQLKDFLFVFYDLESRQERRQDNGDRLHEPNLCVFKTCCELCINNKDNKCKKCGDRLRVSMNYENHNFMKKSPVEWFLNYVLTRRKLYKQIVVIAHNGQAYDHQFALNYILTKTDLKPDFIMRGTKVIQMKVGNVKFIDSLNFFQMALASLPKAFGLGDNFKGYFPHLFNTKINESYVGPLPAVEYYSPDTMKDEKSLETFMKWHSDNKDKEFNFQQELVEYCVNDVEILTAACLKFRELLLEVGNVCPLTESCTIASACNKVFRRNFLNSSTIGIIPRGGYRWCDKQSKIATQWLLWKEKERGFEIQHAANGREAIVNGVKVDGFCEEAREVFEFHGCYYHGCPRCFKYDRDSELHDDPDETLNIRYESTVSKTQRLRELGYKVFEMWECDFRGQLLHNPEIRTFTNDHPLLTHTPLDPRNAFYGGRTGNCSEFYETKLGEKIKYVDVCSLYPWACKYGKFPVGHPKVLVGHEECSKLDLSTITGLIKCKILPPQDLYHPVLPVKMNNKLMFTLCRTCGENMNQSLDCNHAIHERTLHSTWVVEEIVKALEKGYEMMEIQEIWKYDALRYDPLTKTGGLFTEMMNKFIKYKQEATGWPANKTTQGERDAYIEEYLESEGVQLEFNKIVKNPGLRSLAKLILNSFWGKLGQRENQPKTAIVNKPEELLQMINNPYICVNSLLLVNEETVVVNYEYIEEAYEPLSTVNVALAAYTTAHARLKLYSYLEQLGERVLYYDTDSVIYIGREGEYDVPLGEFIGQMTDELEEYGTGSYITECVSGGPKNYSYDVYSTRDKKIHTACKIKGISLNHKTSKIVNKNKMKQMILYDNTPIPIVSSNIRRTKDHKVVTHEETKTYRVNSTKRKFNDSGSVPFGYIKRSCVENL